MTWTTSFFNHWDYWELYHKITVNYDERKIYINEGVTDFSIKVDLYSDLKELWKLSPLAYRYNRFKLPIRVIGGDPTSGGKFAGDIYFLRNEWVVVYDPTKVKVTGTLFSDDYDTPWRFMRSSGRLDKVYPTEVSNLVQSATPSNETIKTIAEAVGENISVDVDFTEVLNEISNLPTTPEISDAVWNKLLADLLVAGSTGERLKKLMSINDFLGLK